MLARSLWCAFLVLDMFAASIAGADEQPPRMLRGSVVDERGNPVADALLVLPLKHGWGKDAWKVEGTTNDKGEFELAVPAEWLELGAFSRDRSLWVHAPGYAVTNTSTYKQLDRGEVAPLKVTLIAEQPVEFQVRGPNGTPLAGCRVQPHHWHKGHIPPEAILERIASTTNDAGVATVHGITPALVRRMEVVSETFGTQRVPTSEGQLTGESPLVLPMLDVGTLEGQLECDDKSIVANVRVAAETRYSQQGLAEGFGMTTTDEEGRFRIANLAEGQYGLSVEVPEGAIVRPVFPTELAIKPHETKTLRIPYVPTAIVRGKVVARGSDKPVSGAHVSVRHGSWRQGEDVMTDENGNYEARVLPGAVRRQLIMIPREFDSWVRWRTPDDPVNVSLDGSPYELPPLELSKAHFVEGTVLDSNDSPLANASISAKVDGAFVGNGRSDSEGKFRLHVAEGVAITSYGILLETTQVLPVEVISKDPLVLKLQDLNKVANITETKSPTPEDKLQPPDSSTADPPHLVVAKNVLLFEGRSTDWATLADEVEKRASAKGGDLTIVTYSRTRATYDDPRRTEEARNWTEMLSETTGVKFQQRGLVFNGAAERYDSLQIGDSFPPGAEHPVCGRVIDDEGNAVKGARVVLLVPMPASSRFRGTASLSLHDGKFTNVDELITTRTDDDGKFQFDFPTTRTNVAIAAPQGFALVGATDDGRDIPLAPWSRVTANVRQDKQQGFQTVTLYAYFTPPESKERAMVHMSMGSPNEQQKAFQLLTVPSSCEISARRVLWKEDRDDRGMVGNSVGERYNFTTEPGMTHHLEFGPVEE